MMPSGPNGGVCLIRRVVIRNYKSIAACDVELGPLTFLVGPNGSGKSNFLDALRFVSDALRYSLEHALRDRGGLLEVRRQSPANPSDFGIRVDFELPSGAHGHYAFRIEGLRTTFAVKEEECFVSADPSAPSDWVHFFRIADGDVRASSLPVDPPAVHDRLYLVNAAGSPAFRPIYDALSSMGFYNLNPGVIREIQAPSPGEFLARDGANLAGVLGNLEWRNPLLKTRIEEYLAQVVPGISAVHVFSMGPRETLAFDYYFEREPTTATFMSTSMSDGTLRALGILTALFQEHAESNGLLLIGVEEPETALHPAATGVLIDAIRDATAVRQVLVTSHSPDLLDNPSIAASEILAVVTENGETRIGHLDEAGRSALRDHLFTAGDLLRMNQLRPDPATRSLNPDDVVLFGTGAPA